MKKKENKLRLTKETVFEYKYSKVLKDGKTFYGYKPNFKNGTVKSITLFTN